MGQGEGVGRKEQKSGAVMGCPSPPFPTPAPLGWERSQGGRGEDEPVAGDGQTDLFPIIDLCSHQK